MAQPEGRASRSLGSSGPRVFPIALGCMGMSGMYGPSDERESLATIHAALAALAAERGVTPSQLAIAWVLAKGPHVVPVVGARTRKQLDESLAALDVSLSAEDVARFEAAVPPEAVAGTRYDERQMKVLDSER